MPLGESSTDVRYRRNFPELQAQVGPMCAIARHSAQLICQMPVLWPYIDPPHALFFSSACRGGAWHAEWQAGPHSFICLCNCNLACPGLVSHVIVPVRANRCGIQPRSYLAVPSIHYVISFYFYFSPLLVCGGKLVCVPLMYKPNKPPWLPNTNALLA